MKEALLIFIKNPVIGQVKTRLAQSVGDERALKIYEELLTKTREVAAGSRGDKHLFYSDHLDDSDRWAPDIFQKFVQTGGDLGSRMSGAFEEAFRKGYEKVVIIGSDCFELTSEIIDQGFTELDQHDLVIGPALDGGYYLLGMKTLHLKLFESIPWSTNKVLIQPYIWQSN